MYAYYKYFVSYKTSDYFGHAIVEIPNEIQSMEEIRLVCENLKKISPDGYKGQNVIIQNFILLKKPEKMAVVKPIKE